MGMGAAGVVLGLLFHICLWLAAEKWFMAGRRLPFGLRAAAAVVVREALAPFLMVQALGSRTIDWRGTDLGGRWRNKGDGMPEEPV
jgi:ceramide glucosyltransferase